MHCNFVKQLARLRKLSSDSVDSPESFSELNRYMHVTRVVENELKDLLRKVKEKNKKTLILLCGSAGDGKSHLLSFLKNEDPEGLLDGIEVYNDATESTAPHLTAIDTLADRLQEFNDQNLGNQSTKKLILAINLGVLNNFIESEKGANFSELKTYVESSEIFSSFTKQYEYREGSPFQHVSFSDFHLYTLKDGKIKTEYLNQLFKKVFDHTNDNPFYRCYKEQERSCTHCSECPVKHNYELLFNPKIRESIINQLVEVSIKDKVVITTREILNFIYDILVHTAFSEKDFFTKQNYFKQLEKYLEHTTPVLTYEQADVSQLLNSVRKHDFLRYRTKELDEFSLSFHTSSDVRPLFERAVKGTPYEKFSELTDHLNFVETNHDLKEKLYRFIIRLNDLKQERYSEDSGGDFKEFIRHLYHQNKGEIDKLDSLYYDVSTATIKWNGDLEPSEICLDDSNEYFWIAEEINLEPADTQESDAIKEEELFRFSPALKISFCSPDIPDRKVELTVDFSLFKMIKSMNKGYLPTIEDKNSHANFASFVQQVIELGKKSKTIELISKESPKERFTFTFNKSLGYQFRKK